ncbi:MAG: ABC transporter permease [Vicinamibacterales bacterium]
MTLLIYLLSILVPKRLRAGWREEWRAEIAAVKQRRGWMAAFRFAATAPLDAVSSRWTTREEGRWKGAWKGAWGSDLKQTLRSVLRSPGHVLTVSLCLGIGIAVCTATFSIMNAFMYGDRPGIEDRGRLPRLYIYGNGRHSDASLDEFAVVAQGSPGLAGIAAEGRSDFSIRVPGHEPMHVVGAFVNGQYFQTLGTRPLAGRLLSPADDRADAPLAVMISYAFWKGRIGSPADIVGRAIVLGDRDAVVAGVAPEGFKGLASDDVDGPGGFTVYVPMAHARTWPGTRGPKGSWFNMAARLRDGVEPAAITAEMQPLAAQLEGMNPERRKNARFVTVSNGLAPGTGNAELIGFMLLMMAAPVTVLAIGCANVANLQLVRASLRSRELAVRASLGASRGQVVRLLTLEAAILSIGGFVTAALLISVLLDIAELVLPVPIDVDLRVLLFSAGVAVAIVAATGLLPALTATRGRTADGLRSGGRSIAGGNSRVRRGLVVAQVAMSFLLLLTAAVFTRGLVLIAGTIPEQASTITVTEFRFDTGNYPMAERRRLLAEFETRMRADSRVLDVALTTASPTSYEQWRVWLPGDAPEVERFIASRHVSPSFFDTSGTRLLRGRIFSPGEPTAVIVDEAFIAEHQLVEPVLGSAFKIDNDDGETTRTVTIVGVAALAPQASFSADADGMMYIPLDELPSRYIATWVRTPYAREMTTVARQTIAQIDANLAPMAIRTLEDHYTEDAVFLGYIAKTAGGLGLVALLLAVSGLYSVIAFFVALRTNEFGIRVALGARAGDIVRMVVGQAGRLVLTGLGIGAVLGTPLLIGLQSAFQFTEPFDPLVILPVALMLGVTALAAAWIPARRASSVDAAVALRTDA